MSRFVAAAVIAALAIGVTAVAQENPKLRKRPNQPGRPAVAAAKKPAAPTTKPASPTTRSVPSVRGEIQTLDIENKTVTVTAKKKGEEVKVVVETDASTEFTLDGAKATLVDLKPGMKVTVTPDTGVATKIAARSVKEQPKSNSEQPKRSSSAQAKRQAANTGKQKSGTPKQSPGDQGTGEPAKAADGKEANPEAKR